VTSLAEKIGAIHRSLEAAGLPHAFGGALALAWCTRRPRATSDIDLNVFVPTSAANSVLAALPQEVSGTRPDVLRLEREGQARLRWDATPIDVFLNVSPFHEAAMRRVSFEPFEGDPVPFLACDDLAVFKAFMDRRRDWADIEEMISARSIDVERVGLTLAGHLGPRDERIATLRSIEREADG